MENKTTVTTNDETKTTETNTWCVYHLIHVRTPCRHLPKLLITKVPRDVKITQDFIEQAGYQFGEFNIAWANHVLDQVGAQESPSDLVYHLRQGDYDRITYDDLVALAEEPI